jgi:hypothetical protein
LPTGKGKPMLGTDYICLALPTLNIIGKLGWRR